MSNEKQLRNSCHSPENENSSTFPWFSLQLRIFSDFRIFLSTHNGNFIPLHILRCFLPFSGSVFISLPSRLLSRVYAFSHFPVYSLTHTSDAVRRGDNLWPRLTWNVSKILMEIITMCTMHVACHFLCLAAIYSQCSQQSTRGSSASSSLVRRRRWRKGKLMTFSFSLFVCCCCVCCDRMWAFNVTFWVDVCLFCYVCQAANNMCGSGSQKQHKKLLLGTLLTQMFQLLTQQ